MSDFKKIFIFFTYVFLISSMFIVMSQPLLADTPGDEDSRATQYISDENIEKTDRLLTVIASPEVTIAILSGFALLVVIVTYFLVVGIIFVIFFSNFGG